MIRDHLYEVLMVFFRRLLPTTKQRLTGRACRSVSPRCVSSLMSVLCLLTGLWAGGARAADSASAEVLSSSEANSDAAAEAARDLLAEYWLPREQLDAARRAALPDWCEGEYRSVPQPVAAGVDPATLPIQAEADAARYFIDDRLELEGDVQIVRGNRRVRTDSATVFEASERAEVRGNVRLEEPGLVLLGQGADVELASDSAQLDDVTFLLTDAGLRGRADNIAQNETGDLLIDSGSVTRCDPGSNTWRIQARSIKVDEGAVWGTARGATLHIKDVPVFYLPYMRFPVDDARQSGWLFPDLGYSGQDGFQLAAPYYINIAPDWDATVTPRVLTERGLGVEGELRHLNHYGNYRVGGAFLPNDDQFNGTLSLDDFRDEFPGGDFQKADRWLLAGEHNGDISGRFGQLDTTVDYTAVSDPDYFRDLGTGLAVSSRVELERRAGVRYRFGDKAAASGEIDTQLWTQRFQRLDEIPTEAYQRLPQFDLNYSRALKGPLEFNLLAQAASFDRNNDDLTGIARIVGERYHVQPELRLPLQWPHAFAEFSGGFRYTAYDLRDVPVGFDDRPERSVGFASADGGLFFERSLSLFGASLIQTLEPRLFYLFQEREAQNELPLFDVTELRFNYNQLFRRNSFSGLDRISDANQLSVGLSSAFVDAANGREYLRASIGQIFFFKDRTVAGPSGLEDDDAHSSSAIAGQVRARVARHWNLNSAVIWDPNDNTVDETLFALGYRKNNRRIANVGYRQGGPEQLDQTDLSFLWGVSRRISVLGRWNYDLNSNRTIEGFAGLEYNDCCWQMRLIARRFIESRSVALIEEVEPDKGVFFQFVFKGLAGFGTKIDTLMQRGIRGYRPDDSNLF